MLNEQVAGLLQNNAGNPAIVSRIAEENGLSQTEIAQALRIPEEAAARYMGGMNPDPTGTGEAGQGTTITEEKPAVGAMPSSVAQKPAAPMPLPSSDGQQLGAPTVSPMGQPLGSSVIAAPTPSNPPGMREAGAAAGGMAPAIGGTMGGTGAGPAGLGTAGMTKPAKLPAGMRPQGLSAPAQSLGSFDQPMRRPLPGATPGRRPGGSPALPRGPGAEGEQAFVNAFNKLRGNAK